MLKNRGFLFPHYNFVAVIQFFRITDLFPHFPVLHAVDFQHVGEGRVAGEGFDGGGGQVGLQGVHALGDEGEVFGAEVVGLEAAVEFLILPADLGAEVFDFHLSHALHFAEDFFARGGHGFSISLIAYLMASSQASSYVRNVNS